MTYTLVDLNITSFTYLQQGDTPLLRSCKRGFEKIAALLIEAGADVNIVNKVSKVS